MKYKIILFFILFSFSTKAMEITGFVYTITDGIKEPLIGANIFTQDKKYGTSTDLDGKFKLLLPNKPPYTYIQVSSVSFETKTINILDKNYFEVELKPSSLEEIVVERKKTDRPTSSPYGIQVIDAGELTKAACCNLS